MHTVGAIIVDSDMHSHEDHQEVVATIIIIIIIDEGRELGEIWRIPSSASPANMSVLCVS